MMYICWGSSTLSNIYSLLSVKDKTERKEITVYGSFTFRVNVSFLLSSVSCWTLNRLTDKLWDLLKRVLFFTFFGFILNHAKKAARVIHACTFTGERRLKASSPSLWPCYSQNFWGEVEERKADSGCCLSTKGFELEFFLGPGRAAP